MIRLFTLGALSLQAAEDGASPVPLKHTKRNALLAYLAFERSHGSHARDTLLAMFWPESDERHARDALKQLLRSLRRDLGDYAFSTAGSNGVALARTTVWCDSVALAEAADQRDFSRALELYRGDFLPGLHLQGAPDFDDWAAREAERLRRMAAACGRAHSEAQEASGDLEGALRSIRRVLEIKPFDEPSLRALMRLHLATGDQAEAVMAYEAYTERLGRELDAGPAVETVELFERARSRVVIRPEPGEVVLQPRTRPERPASQTRRRWDSRRKLAAGAALIAISAVALSLSSPPPPEANTLHRERILVDIFENQTGDPTLDYLGRAAANHVTAGLTFTSVAEVVTRGDRLLSRFTGPIPSDTDPFEAAIDLGVGTLVQGAVSLSGDSVRFDALLVDTESQTVMGAVRPISAPLDAATDALEALRDQVMARIAAYVDPRLATWSRHASKPPTFEAYQIFVTGLEAHTTPRGPIANRGTGFDWPRARALFDEAYRADPSFTIAAFWTMIAAGNMGDRAARDSILGSLYERRRELPEVDRLLVEAHAAPSPVEALSYWRRYAEIAPGSDYLNMAAYDARRAGRIHEALRYYRAADPASGWLWGWHPYWYRFADALDVAGECDEILELAEQARQTQESTIGHRIGLRLELRGHSCSGDADRLAAITAHYLVESRRLGWGPHATAFPLHRAGLDLITHAPDGADVRTSLDLITNFLEAHVEEDEAFPGMLGELLASSRREDSARVVLDRAHAADGDRQPDAYGVAVLAAVEARAGSTDRAIALMADARDGIAPLEFAALVGHLGDRDRTMAELTRARQEQRRYAPYLHFETWLLAPLLSDAEFRVILAPYGDVERDP